MAGIGDILSGVGNLVDAGTNIANSVNAKKNAEKNLQFSKEQYEYQKRLQQTIFDREDNAVQRRVADLKAAGLSPVLAAGSGAGAGQAVSTVAPHAETPEINVGLGQKVQSVLDAMSAIEQIKKQKVENSLVQAQKSYYDSQSAKVEQEKTNLETINAGQQIKNESDLLDLNYAKESGINPNRQSSNPSHDFINGIKGGLRKLRDKPKYTRAEASDLAMKNLGLDKTKMNINPIYSLKNMKAYRAEYKRLLKERVPIK